MLKHSEYSIFLCKDDRGERIDKWLNIHSKCGFVKWDDKGGCIVSCPSEKAWHEWWATLELLHTGDEYDYLVANDLVEDDDEDD
jgi:hypothetical protein